MLPEPSITNSTVGFAHDESTLIGALSVRMIIGCAGLAELRPPAAPVAAVLPALTLVLVLSPREASREPGADGSAPQCSAAHAPRISATRTLCE